MCLLSGADADLPESGRDWVRLGSSRDCSELCLLAGVEQHRKYLPPNSQPLQDDDRQRVFEQICIRRWNSQTNLQLHEHENLCKWVSLCFYPAVYLTCHVEFIEVFSPGLSRPTPTATAASDIFTTNRRQAGMARRCISILSLCCFADVVRLRLGLILSVGRRAYRLYGVAAGRTQPGILNAAPSFLLIDTRKQQQEKVLRKCLKLSQFEIWHDLVNFFHHFHFTALIIYLQPYSWNKGGVAVPFFPKIQALPGWGGVWPLPGFFWRICPHALRALKGDHSSPKSDNFPTKMSLFSPETTSI